MPINIDKAKMGDVVKDFYKSDAPQFKGKSKAKRRQMAVAAKLSTEETKVNEGKLAKQWQQGAKKLKASGLELVRGSDGYHSVKKNGREIGNFWLDDGPGQWVVQAPKWRQQEIVPDVDDIPALFEGLLDKLKDRRKAKAADKKIDKLGKIANNAYNKDDEKTGYRAMTLQRKMLRRKAGTELTRKLPEHTEVDEGFAPVAVHPITKKTKRFPKGTSRDVIMRWKNTKPPVKKKAATKSSGSNNASIQREIKKIEKELAQKSKEQDDLMKNWKNYGLESPEQGESGAEEIQYEMEKLYQKLHSLESKLMHYTYEGTEMNESLDKKKKISAAEYKKIADKHKAARQSGGNHANTVHSFKDPKHGYVHQTYSHASHKLPSVWKSTDGKSHWSENVDETEISEVSNNTLKSYIKKSTKRNKDFDDRDYQTGVKGLVKHAIKGKPTKAEYGKAVKRTGSEELARHKLRKRGYDDTKIAKPSHQRPQYEATSTATGKEIGDTGWRKATVRKDKYGNVIKRKNIAKHLAKKGAKEAEKMREASDIPHRGTLRDVKMSDKAKKGPKTMRDMLKDLRAGKGKIEYMRKVKEEVEAIDEGIFDSIKKKFQSTSGSFKLMGVIDTAMKTGDTSDFKSLMKKLNGTQSRADLNKFVEVVERYAMSRAKKPKDYVTVAVLVRAAKDVKATTNEEVEQLDESILLGSLAALGIIGAFGFAADWISADAISQKTITRKILEKVYKKLTNSDKKLMKKVLYVVNKNPELKKHLETNMTARGFKPNARSKAQDMLVQFFTQEYPDMDKAKVRSEIKALLDRMSKHARDIAKGDVKEDVEQVDELKKSTYANYINKSIKDKAKHDEKGFYATARKSRAGYTHFKKSEKRSDGIRRASATLSKKLASESVEQIDEISAGLRKRYIKKATADKKKQDSHISKEYAKYKKKQPTPSVGRNHQADKDYAAYGKATKTARNKSINRSDGIERARSPMHYEGVEKWIAVDTSSKSLNVYGPFSSKQKGEQIMKDSGVKSFKVVLQKPMKESSDHLQELTDKEKALIAKRKEINTRRGGGAKRVAKPKPVVAKKPSNKTSSIRDSSERNIIMQLRKAQDVGGKHEIEFRRDTATLDKKTIDTLLKVHDGLAKPQDKRKFRIAITQNSANATKVAKTFQSKGH